MLSVFADNNEHRCFQERKVLVLDGETSEAFVYRIMNCTSGGGGWVGTWDDKPTDRNMEVLQFLYNSWEERIMV